VSNNPDDIRRDIEQTRGQLSQDVTTLTETVSPSNVARRQADKLSGAASSVKDRVMGSAGDARSAVGGAASGVGDATSAVGDATSAATDKARRATNGNPLAAGAIALAAGWLLGSLLPASAKEQQAAGALKEKAQPLVEEGKHIVQDATENLKEPAKQAAQSVADTAAEAKDHLAEEGQSTTQSVTGQVQESAENVQSTRS
jgi:ElaB/YqjD/DUF883 family membrane-anchored ribosome-binding protein